MKKLIFLFCFPVILGLLSCTDDEVQVNDTNDGTVFIFGSYNGFCQGNCAHLFKYENEQVFRDNINRFEDDNLSFSDDSEEELLTVAQRLFTAFPEFLKDSEQEVYGCPGCADQSTLYISIGDGESVQSWKLDSFEQEDWPQELKNYVDLLVNELEKIIIY